MPDPSSNTPENVKLTPRLRVRKHEERKKRKKKEGAPPQSAGRQGDVDELSAVIRLLERLSEKPAGKALLESVIASAAEQDPSAAAAPGDIKVSTVGNEESRAKNITIPAIERFPARSPAAAANPTTNTPLEKSGGSLPPTGERPAEASSAKSAPPVDGPKAPSDPQSALDEAMGAALEEALVESEEEDEIEFDDDGLSPEGESFLARQRRRARRRSKRRQTLPNWKATGFPMIRLALLLLLGLSLFASGIIVAYTLGLREQKRIAKTRPAPVLKDGLDPGDASQLDLALAAIRDGEPFTAIPILEDLAKREPPIPSLSYLRAIASLQAGNTAAAMKFAQESIDKGERVSDSHALLAQAVPRDEESQLQKAAAADPSNPFPLIELANLKRRAGQNAESMRLLRSARLRLLPVDSHIATEVQEILIRLEETQTGDLPKDPPGSSRVARLWSGAYLALRRGEPEKAEDALSTLLLDTDIDNFRYHISDPAFRLYLSEPKIERFFKM